MRVIVFMAVLAAAFMALLAFDIMVVSDTKTHIIPFKVSSGTNSPDAAPSKPY